jgi:glycosyltransferase involved in cell wall biosynthesis
MGPEGGRACATHCFGDQDEAELRWSLRTRAFVDALVAADDVWAPSQFVVDAFAGLRGEAQPIRIVENSIARMGPALRPERFPGAPLRLASIGVTVEHKGFGVVVDAIRQSRIPRIFYTIFGLALPPVSFELYEMADHAPGLGFHLASSYAPHQLPVMLAEVDIVVVPSVVPETYSIVAREAFANGIPVIASNSGALPAAVRPEENGWLFEPGDGAGLAALLQELSTDPGRVKRAAEGIRPDDWVTLEARTDLIERLLRKAIGRGANAMPSEVDELMLMREAIATGDAEG